jgi:hypothetical protein
MQSQQYSWVRRFLALTWVTFERFPNISREGPNIYAAEKFTGLLLGFNLCTLVILIALPFEASRIVYSYPVVLIGPAVLVLFLLVRLQQSLKRGPETALVRQTISSETYADSWIRLLKVISYMLITLGAFLGAQIAFLESYPPT